MKNWNEEIFSSYKKRVRVALGRQAPDTLFTRCRILNVFTGEILKQDLALSGDRIAYLSEGGPHAVGGKTHVVDLNGKIIVPGYFDAHAHTDLFYTPWEFARSVVSRGTTAVFSDSHDMANGLGIEGFLKVLEASSHFPIRFLSGVPLASPPYPVEGEDLYDLAKVRRLLKQRDVVRSGSELTPWVKILRQDVTLLRKLYTVRKITGRLEGHTVGARERKLSALVAAGMTSCHESMTLDDVKERLRRGLYVMIRQGSIRKEFDRLHPFFRAYHPRIMLTPDGMFADEIVEKGYMNAVLQEAMRYGADPISVIRMVTLNPAVYFGVEAHLGGIAPARLADFNILDHIEEPTPAETWVGGRCVGREGKYVGPAYEGLSSLSTGRPFRSRSLRAGDFRARYPTTTGKVIPIIDVLDQTVTGIYPWVPRGLPDGTADPAHDIMKIAIIHRNGPEAGMGIGYVHGFGMTGETQIASSVAHETHHVMTMGADDEEMARAVNEVLAMEGGIVIRSGGETLYRWQLPVGGMMSSKPMEEVAKALRDLRAILRKRGSWLPDPLWTFGFLSFTSILRLRMTLSGVYDVREGTILYNATAV